MVPTGKASLGDDLSADKIQEFLDMLTEVMEDLLEDMIYKLMGAEYDKKSKFPKNGRKVIKMAQN